MAKHELTMDRRQFLQTMLGAAGAMAFPPRTELLRQVEKDPYQEVMTVLQPTINAGWKMIEDHQLEELLLDSASDDKVVNLEKIIQALVSLNPEQLDHLFLLDANKKITQPENIRLTIKLTQEFGGGQVIEIRLEHLVEDSARTNRFQAIRRQSLLEVEATVGKKDAGRGYQVKLKRSGEQQFANWFAVDELNGVKLGPAVSYVDDLPGLKTITGIDAEKLLAAVEQLLPEE